VSNIDLSSTFETIAGRAPRRDRSGTSFQKVLREPTAKGGRFAFFEHTWTLSSPDGTGGAGDPDWTASLNHIPSNIAVRSKHGLLVRVDMDNDFHRSRYAWELYDYTRNPFEKANTYGRDRNKRWARILMRKLMAFDNHGRGCTPASCRKLQR
jgi:hypothetical protein